MVNSKKIASLKMGSWHKLAVGAAAVAGVAAVVACASSDRADEPILATSADPLQTIYLGSTESDTTHGVNLVTTSSTSRKGKSTGAIRSYTDDGYSATCGVTFVSHHYAVTAAHCVDSFNVDTTFTIEQYDTTGMTANAIYNTDSVGPTGYNSWPNYTKSALTSAMGYKVTSYSCQLKRRCNTTYGDLINCPLNYPYNEKTDVAMLYCSSRSSSGSNWVPVSTSNDSGQTVQVWWFHEIVDLATDNSDPYNPYMPQFNFYHYGELDSHASNYHYNHPTNLQPVPLVSKHDSANVAYRAGTPTTYYTPTTIPVCHGTSGSGVMLANSDALVGVVSTGGFESSNLLCANVSATSGHSMNYVSRARLVDFTNVNEVKNDRQ